MSTKSPPTLMDLAQKSLLQKETLAILALEQLPRQMFPPLFVDAFTARLKDTLKALVRAWPFDTLPLGALMKEPQLEILKAVLDGLDTRPTRRSGSRMCKLQTLDLRIIHGDFWSACVRGMDYACSPGPLGRMQPVQHGPRLRARSAVRVIANLCLTEIMPNEFLAHLLQWVKRRRHTVHLCCNKLKIEATFVYSIHRVLDALELGCIQEVNVRSPWHLSTLARFAFYLGRMSNLQKLCLSHICVSDSSSEEQEEYISHFISQFLKLHRLRRLHMRGVSFLQDRLDRVLRCLSAPLEALSITNCVLSEVDLLHLSQCPFIFELRHLYLSRVPLTSLRPESLRVLLENVAATLKTLDLLDCEITDSQLSALLPALSRCSQLTTFCFYGNRFSMEMMAGLMRHTGNLSNLRQEHYPAPLESYNAQGTVQRARFIQLCQDLLGILREIREPQGVVFRTLLPCRNWDPRLQPRRQLSLAPALRPPCLSLLLLTFAALAASWGQVVPGLCLTSRFPSSGALEHLPRESHRQQPEGLRNRPRGTNKPGLSVSDTSSKQLSLTTSPVPIFHSAGFLHGTHA
ncbi:PRAME family member 12-like [Lepus europaeus]|uniref:PRAME family member 12-like n=1 Tax=Lepus europaeus TaxID=9983 RepID=UPI002B46677A|nr:PRAME family member 12-like [Lepus europaeus]